MKAKFSPEQFVEIKWNKRIAQNKTFCSVFLCLSHSFIFFQDKVLEFFINNPLRNPHNPLPLPALQIPHAQSLDYTNPIITLSGTTQLEKTHVVEKGHPEYPSHLLNRKAITAAALFRKLNVLLHLIERAPTSSKSRVVQEKKKN